MKIWLINNYNMLPEHGHLNRNFYLGKYMKLHGHEPVAFVGSHPHNTKLQLIEGKEKYRVYQKDPFPWVLIKTRNYEKSKIQRVISMFEFYHNMKIAAKQFDKPDAIIGSSAHPLAALLALRLGKKYNCKKIVEIRDLWPESIVAYGILKRNNPIIKVLYKLEKYLYTNADIVVFTFENAYRYFKERGLDKTIPESKVKYVNNGIDLEGYEHNLANYKITDDDLNNENYFNVVYTGSIRKVNNVGIIIDVAKLLKDSNVRFLIWGDGDERQLLESRVKEERITNVRFKGAVEKKYIPYITSMADLNFLHNSPSPMFKYGISMNKLFDYAAAGKPILTDFPCNSNPVVSYKAGVEVSSAKKEEIAKAIIILSNSRNEEYREYCNNAKRMAYDFSYDKLASKFEQLIMDI